MDPWRNIGSLSKEEIINLQERNLQHFITKRIYPFSEHYRAVFDQNNIDPNSIKTIQDLSKIPFTSKRDFHNKEYDEPFRRFILIPDKEKIKESAGTLELLKLAATKMIKGEEYLKDQMNKEYRPVFMTFTTGTTNKPTPFVYTNYDINNLHISGARMLKLFGVGDDDKIVNCFPFAPHLAFWQVVFGGLASNKLILSTGGGKSIGTDGNIAAIEKIKPSVILGVPSYIYHVLRTAQEKDCRMDYIKKIILGASRITSDFKKKLAELVIAMGGSDVSVLGTYGFTESRCAWGECPTSLDISSGYHLNPDKEIFEIIDPETGEQKGEDENGEIVYTALDSRGSSVLRYRTGDYVKGGITFEPCPHCGSRVPRLSSDITRLSNVKDMQLSKVKGALVNFNNFETSLSEIADLDEWQLEIKKKNDDPYEVDEMIVYACSKSGCNEKKLSEEIKKKLLIACEVSPNDVKFVDMDEILERLELETANKEKRIIDKRPKE